MDMSMRSTGLVALKPDDSLVEFDIIKSTKDDFPDTEQLIAYIVLSTMLFIKHFKTTKFVIEGLAFGAKSSSKDILAGIYWAVRTEIWTKCPDILIGSIPVQSWRSKVLNKEERKYAKENYSPKSEALKIATVKKLPPHIHKDFLDYVHFMTYNEKSMYDLADAYFLGIHRNSLDD
jgi:hypothetical protein